MIQGKNNLWIVITLMSANMSFAQTYKDAGLWTTFSIEFPINKEFSLALDEELRLKENFSEIDLFYTNLGIIYKPSKHFKFDLTYRNAQKLRYFANPSFRNRLSFDFTIRHKLDPWIFSMRTRLQGEFKDYFTSEYGKIPEYHFRNKFEVKYDLDNDFEVYTSVEFRLQLYGIDFPEANGLYHRIRPVVGFDYKIDKKKSFGAYYLIQKEWNVSEREELYIIGLQYSMSL